MQNIFCQFKNKVYFFTLKLEDDYVAQLVEHIPFKDGVLGSNPSMITKGYYKLDN